MFWRVVAVLCAVTFLFGGCDVLLSDDCSSVDFGGNRRMLAYTCHTDANRGEMSASATGVLFLLGGLALIFLASWPLPKAVMGRRHQRETQALMAALCADGRHNYVMLHEPNAVTSCIDEDCDFDKRHLVCSRCGRNTYQEATPGL